MFPRLVSGIQQGPQNGNWLAQDAEGNNLLTIAAIQVKQNIWGAAFTAGSTGIVAAILRKFGM